MLAVQITKKLPNFTLKAAFQVPEGQVTVLFGRSGAGKTSIVNMIAGLLRPDQGQICLQETILYDSALGVDRRPETRRIGYVFQDSRLFPHLSVHDNLRYGERLRPAGERYVSLQQIVAMLDIGSLLHRPPFSLSGGEQQRVAIGRALLTSPRLLLLDEPLAALDGALKAEILPYLERLKDDVQIPILYVSHAIQEVSRLAEQMIVLSQGQIVAQGKIDQVMSRIDLHPVTGRYEAGSILDGRVAAIIPEVGLMVINLLDKADQVRAQLQVPVQNLEIGEKLRLRIRARDVGLALYAPTDTSFTNIVSARVLALSTETGPIVNVALALGADSEETEATVSLSARVTLASARRLGLRTGLPLYALIKGIALDGQSLGLPFRNRMKTDGYGS